MMKSIRGRLAALFPRSSGRRPWLDRSIAFKVSWALGYSLVLSLLLNNYLVIKTMEEMRRENDLVTNSYALRSQQLDHIQIDIIAAGLVVRDFVLTLESGPVQDYNNELLRRRATLDQAMKEFASMGMLEGEQGAWQMLQKETADFWNSIGQILALYPGHPPRELKDLLNDTVVKRKRVWEIAAHLQAINQQVAEGKRRQIESMYQKFRWNILTQTVTGLLIGLLIAVVSYRYFGRLQSELVQQYGKDMENKENLRRLSTHLVHMQEEERKAISRELHDQIGQSLTGVRIILGKVERQLSPAQEDLQDEIREAKEVAEQIIKDVRELSHLLHPAILDDLGLIPALQSFIERFARYNDIRVEFTASTVTERFSEELETNLYRIIQEALCNVAKHAHATRVGISLARRGDTLELYISDDGQGFLTTGLRPKKYGLGLLNMRERITGLGGAFVVDSQPGRGTHLYARLPVGKAVRPSPALPCHDWSGGLKS